MTRRTPERELPPGFLDFEASSLASASNPIEVAWSLPDGGIESHLISPASIDRWTDWSAQAERLHGISRARLLAEGKSPMWVCRRLNEQLAGRMVYTDAPEYDGVWLNELFSACWGGAPSFTLASADELLVGMLAPRFVNHADSVRELAAIKCKVRQRLPQRHRAGWDVEYLVELWRIVNQTLAAYLWISRG
ncbi:hypothetical protein [Thiocystis minor]|uniref:hypothetical protein n=1 Tax=Thiocystis minor TaxID=61597 RepID=UPI001912687A|nr:hypothetical protein [Thiocystis minor]